MGDWLDLVDTLDVPTMGVVVAYGFWKVIGLLHKIELRLVAVETKVME